VTNISPTSGPTAGGTAVTLTGTNFTGATAVTIGGNACTPLSATTATSVTCTTPSGAAGTASVLVTTSGGTNASNTLYTYTPVKSYTGASPSGPGNITAAFTGGNASCAYATSQFSSAQTPPAGVTLTYGVFNFTTNDCGTGNALNFTITYPQNLPAGTRYYKFGPEFGASQIPHWYVLAGAVVNGNQISLTITDNGAGDSNPAAGFITDPGGPGVLDGSAATAIPTLSEWGLITLSGLLSLVTLVVMRRRPM
jgi:hypothetical protein